MSKDDSILGAVGDLISAMAGEVDIISSSSSSLSSPSSSGAGNYSSSSGGSDGYSSDDSLGVTSHVRGSNSGHTIKVGNTEYHYNGGMKGYIDALLGGKPVATSVITGDRISHKDSRGKEVAHSVVASDGTVNTYNNKDMFIGRKTPVQLSPSVDKKLSSQSNEEGGGDCSNLRNTKSSNVDLGGGTVMDNKPIVSRPSCSTTPYRSDYQKQQDADRDETELGKKDGISGRRRQKYSDLYNRAYQLHRTYYTQTKRNEFLVGFNDAQAKRISALGTESYKEGYEFGSQKFGRGYFDGRDFRRTKETDVGYIADYLTAIIPVIKSIFFKIVDCRAEIDRR